MPTETPTAPLLVGGRQMAAMLNISERTIYSLRLEGLPALKVGTALRYQPAAVLSWLTEHHAAERPAKRDETE